MTTDWRSFDERKKNIIRDCFREVFYKYVRPGRGSKLGWNFHDGGDKRKHVMSNIKMLLSWVSDDDLTNVTDTEVFIRLLHQYKTLVHYYKGKYLDEYITYKYGEIDLD